METGDLVWKAEAMEVFLRNRLDGPQLLADLRAMKSDPNLPLEGSDS